MIFTTSSLLAALLLDRLLGEPKRYHPLVIWGGYASKIESLLNKGNSPYGKALGIVAWLIAVAIPALIISILFTQLAGYGLFALEWLASSVCLYLAIGWQSLREHGMAVAKALQLDIESARQAVARIVSRNTESMDEPAVVRGVLESLLENGADAIFAPLFWYVVAGPVGVVVYRLANTLDAMWGYRTPRFTQFGWFSARVDDVLNWLPARLTALSYALLGKTAGAMASWRSQASQCASPNGGPVMCAGAGSLNVLLGGPTMYHGEWQQKVIMGCGSQPVAKDIDRAIKLVDNTVYSWALFAVGLMLLLDGGVTIA